MTDEGGRFFLHAHDRDFVEFFDHSPDVYFQVTLPGGRVHSTRRDMRWNVGRVEHFMVEVPEAELAGHGGDSYPW